jgi:YHS domain-containing protein
MRKTMWSCFVVAVVLCSYVGSRAADAPQLKCPLSGKAAGTQHSAEHNGGRVYFCCDKCAKAFAAHPEKYAAQANLQLVLSGQFKEVKCPLEGYALNSKAEFEVGGVRVTFCCKGCKNVVALAKGNDQLNLVFSDKAFKKGFEKIAADEKK